MYAMSLPSSLSSADDVFFIGRRVLSLLRDPRSDARRLARLIDHVPPLADAVVERAEVALCGRGRVHSTTSAIALIGFDRLERTVRGYLRAEYARLRAAEERAGEDGLALPAPRPELRYAAM